MHINKKNIKLLLEEDNMTEKHPHYVLPKIHKPGILMGPIISGIDTASH